MLQTLFIGSILCRGRSSEIKISRYPALYFGSAGDGGKEIGCVTIFKIVKRIGGKTLNSIPGELSIWISTAIL